MGSFEKFEGNIESNGYGNSNEARAKRVGYKGMELAAAMQKARSWTDLSCAEDMGRGSGWRRVASPEGTEFPNPADADSLPPTNNNNSRLTAMYRTYSDR